MLNEAELSEVKAPNLIDILQNPFFAKKIFCYIDNKTLNDKNISFFLETICNYFAEFKKGIIYLRAHKEYDFFHDENNLAKIKKATGKCFAIRKIVIDVLSQMFVLSPESKFHIKPVLKGGSPIVKKFSVKIAGKNFFFADYWE